MGIDSEHPPALLLKPSQNLDYLKIIEAVLFFEQPSIVMPILPVFSSSSNIWNCEVAKMVYEE